MSPTKPIKSNENQNLSLTIRKTINASPERIFRAWVEPDELKNWWGPSHVECSGAEVDLRVGGRYRIGNRLPDGQEVWIFGKFEIIERPNKLVYTWSMDPDSPNVERVTVTFKQQDEGTEVTVRHEQIPTSELRTNHNMGWNGCIEGLILYLES